MEPNLVSAVIPAYNCEEFVREAIDSALAQTYPNVEVIVVDDGSTDGTWDAIGEYKNDSRVRAFRQTSIGASAARNRGIAEARGQYVAFLDADDLWMPGKTEKQVALFNSHPDLGLVYCLLRKVARDQRGEWVDDPEWDRYYATVRFPRGNSFRYTVEAVFTGMPCTMIPRRVLDAVGGFCEDLRTGEDREMHARIAHDYAVDYVAERLVIVRGRPNSLSSDPSIEPHTLKFLRRIADLYPECSLQGKGWMPTVYANCARESGFDALYAGRTAQARAELWEACKFRPLRLSNWLYYALARLPAPLLAGLRGLRRRCRRSRPAR